jgi:hypothetical protein
VIAVVAPEPAPWVAPVVAGIAAAGGDAVVIAPWAVWARRALRPWVRRRTDRQIRSGLAIRALADRWAALRVARLRGLSQVVAPTGAAWRTFAAAERRGAGCVLVMDRPCLRQLHRDLDRAARALPERRFLRRYRADRAAIVRQESEWVLANEILVRGAYARDVLVAAGIAADRVRPLPVPPPARSRRRGGALIRLAGLATARNGVDAAVAACAEGGRILAVRAGEGTEPADLLARPGVIAAPPDLDGVACVVAPGWCESYAREVELAAAVGVPVVATRAAAGWAAVREVPAGDPGALSRAIVEALVE